MRRQTALHSTIASIFQSLEKTKAMREIWIVKAGFIIPTVCGMYATQAEADAVVERLYSADETGEWAFEAERIDVSKLAPVDEDFFSHLKQMNKLHNI